MQKMLSQISNQIVHEKKSSGWFVYNAAPFSKPPPILAKMAKGQASTKHAASKLKARPQAQKSGGQPKRGIHRQKRPASDGSDNADSSDASPKGPRARPRKKTRRAGGTGKENEEEVEEEESEEEVEQVADSNNDNGQSDDVEEVSPL